jgi:hypothetical protein
MTAVAGGTDDLGRWEPMPLPQAVEIFASLGDRTPWWIAGGYAIELFVGRELRDHDDVDVLLLRRDQHVVHELLPGWDVQAADPPGRLRPWQPGEVLPLGVHDIWCRETPASPWRLQVMLDESEGEQWRSRRDRRVELPVAELGRRTTLGWPYLAPEVQLFYKATSSELRAKDLSDFAVALPLLDQAERLWLDRAIGAVRPDHPWRDRLASAVLRQGGQ